MNGKKPQKAAGVFSSKAKKAAHNAHESQWSTKGKKNENFPMIGFCPCGRALLPLCLPNGKQIVNDKKQFSLQSTAKLKSKMGRF